MFFKISANPLNLWHVNLSPINFERQDIIGILLYDVEKRRMEGDGFSKALISQSY